jgi:hypothetical protein
MKSQMRHIDPSACMLTENLLHAGQAKWAKWRHPQKHNVNFDVMLPKQKAIKD